MAIVTLVIQGHQILEHNDNADQRALGASGHFKKHNKYYKQDDKCY